jgi:hypothetical protein
MPSNSLAATPPGSPAPAASGSPLVDEQDLLALVAFVAGKPQLHDGFGGGARAAVLFALFSHVAAGFRVAIQEHAEAA